MLVFRAESISKILSVYIEFRIKWGTKGQKNKGTKKPGLTSFLCLLCFLCTQL